MTNSPRFWISLTVVAFIALYAGVHFSAAHSEGFKFVEREIRKSEAVQRRAGHIRKVELGILDSYSEKYAGDDKWVRATVHVVGARATLKVKTAAKKVGGQWMITDIWIEGDPAA